MHNISLKYFHSVAQTGSLSAASTQLHVAVSAISRQISQLEERLQLKLFERKPRGMSLTPAGEILYTYSLRKSVELNNVIAEMKGLNNLQMQTIALACPEGLAWDFLPFAITRFREHHPNAIFSLKVVDSSEATQLVKKGIVDVALTFSVQVEQSVKIALQVPSPIIALLSEKHPLAHNDKLSVHDLKDYPLALSEPGTTLTYLFETACHLEGISIVPALTSNSMGAIYTYTKENINTIALCASLTVGRLAERDKLIILPMTEDSFSNRTIQLQVMSERDQPIIIQHFLDFLISTLTD